MEGGRRREGDKKVEWRRLREEEGRSEGMEIRGENGLFLLY